MKITVPEFALVVLIGCSGSGKSTFARKNFKPTEVLSSDFFRGLVSDDENDQAATKDAFDVLQYVAAKRLKDKRLTVIDATNVQQADRKTYIDLAREYHCLPVALVLNLPERVCQDRNAERPDRNYGPHVVSRQHEQLRRSLKGLQKEGFRQVHVLSSMEDIDSLVIERQRLWTDRSDEHGPFDIIGDIHGCYDELVALLERLGYCRLDNPPEGSQRWGDVYGHPEGRKAVFLGDLVDRGPRILDTLNLVHNMVRAGTAIAVPGNHDIKFMRWLRGKDVRITHGLDSTIHEVERLPEEERAAYRQEMAAFLDSLISHYVLDDERLVVAHAGMKETLQGRASAKVREFALFGETTGENDDYGLPVRYDWARDYRGSSMVVYGHTPVPETEWINGTINIDTGCVYGGRLTALRYPERELVSVHASKTYYEPVKPFQREEVVAPRQIAEERGNLLDIEDVLGKRVVSTRLFHNITIREENATAALEVMSRFATDPRWLIYLPPTMSPPETTKLPGLLEHPAEAFAYYRKQGVEKVICQEKHMGSRAVVIVCRDAETASRRFGIAEPSGGVCYTRTGRRFFEDATLEAQFIDRIRQACEAAGFWADFGTDWICLDCELMPWSAKAQDLLKKQYAPVGTAASVGLRDTIRALEVAAESGREVSDLLQAFKSRADMIGLYRDAYRRYCWPVHTIDDLRLAPFHLLATEGSVHIDKTHTWHMSTLARLAAADARLLVATGNLTVDLTNPESLEDGIRWWEALTGRGGEGMVVKPLDFVATGPRGLIQPAVKCRGPEYLRIIYGPEYSAPGHLERLKERAVGSKRALALREFALGIEALERFVKREPLFKVHECAFGVLALESEPVDPRL